MHSSTSHSDFPTPNLHVPYIHRSTPTNHDKKRNSTHPTLPASCRTPETLNPGAGISERNNEQPNRSAMGMWWVKGLSIPAWCGGKEGRDEGGRRSSSGPWAKLQDSRSQWPFLKSAHSFVLYAGPRRGGGSIVPAGGQFRSSGGEGFERRQSPS